MLLWAQIMGRNGEVSRVGPLHGGPAPMDPRSRLSVCLTILSEAEFCLYFVRLKSRPGTTQPEGGSAWGDPGEGNTRGAGAGVGVEGAQAGALTGDRRP